VGPGLGESLRLGLESVPRLATSGWPVRTGGLWTLGSAAALGSTAASATIMGARGQRDLEPDRPRLGILEQRNMDPDLNAQGWAARNVSFDNPAVS
jgi:hypothetical protein